MNSVPLCGTEERGGGHMQTLSGAIAHPLLPPLAGYSPLAGGELKKQLLSCHMVRTLLILCTLLFCFTAKAQDRCCKCKKPDHAPRNEKHLNCLNDKDQYEGVWKFYSYYGFLLQTIGFDDNKIVWSISNRIDGKPPQTTGTPPDSILNPKKKHRWQFSHKSL